MPLTAYCNIALDVATSKSIVNSSVTYVTGGLWVHTYNNIRYRDICLWQAEMERNASLVYDSLCDIMFQPSIQRAETDWYFMYCRGVRPHTVAWGYIIYPVPCLVCRAPFRYNSKSLHYAMVWEVMFHSSFSLSSPLTWPLNSVRGANGKTNTTSSFLSIAHFVPHCVSVWSILIIDHITPVILHRNGTLMTLQQWTAIFREMLKLCWETLKGTLKREEAGWQPLLLLVGEVNLVH